MYRKYRNRRRFRRANAPLTKSVTSCADCLFRCGKYCNFDIYVANDVRDETVPPECPLTDGPVKIKLLDAEYFG